MFPFFFSFVISDSVDARFTSYAIKRSISNPQTVDLELEIPDFNSGRWRQTNRGTILSNTTIRVPGNTRALDAPQITIALKQYGNLYYQYFVNDCTTIDSQNTESKAKCYINMNQVNSSNQSSPLYNRDSILGKITEYVMPRTPYTIHSFYLYLENLSPNSVVFSLPHISFRNYTYEAMDYKLDETGKVTVSVKANEEIQLSSIILTNPYEQPNKTLKYDFILARLPIVANGTHIVGMDIEETRFFVPWDYVMNSFAHFFLNLSARQDFTLSFYVIEEKTTCYLDALEKWHNKFPHIYHKQHFGVGNWVPFDWNKDYDDLDTTFLARFFWGSEKYKKQPCFQYVEPTMYHISDMRLGNTIEETTSALKNCMNNQNNPNHEKCYYAVHYSVRGPDGSYYGIYNEDASWNHGIAGYIRMEPEAFDYYFNPILSTVTSRSDRDGVALDSFGYALHNSYQVEGDDPFPSAPFLLVDREHKKFLNVLTGLFDSVNKCVSNLTSLGKNHFMVNAMRVFPQFVQYIDMAGYESNVFGEWNTIIYDLFLQLRYTMGSRALSMLETVTDQQALTMTENYFSICASLGIMPSYFSLDGTRLYADSKTLELKRPDYVRWGPILNQTLNHTYYRANNLGRLNFTNSTTSAGTADQCSVSMFCEEGDSICYIFAMIVGEGTMEINIHENVPFRKSSVIFEAKDLSAKAKGRKITLKRGSVEANDLHRTACIRIEFIDPLLNGGEIAAIVLGILLAIVLSAFFIYVFVIVPKRQQNDDHSVVSMNLA